MKIIVKTPIDVRIGAPSSNAPSFQHLAIGSEIEVDDNLYSGDTIAGIDKWYKDKAGNYYWSGGVETSNKIKLSYDKLTNYNDLIPNIPDQIRKTKGKNINVAILDSGVNQVHPDLKDAFTNSLFQSYDFTGSKVGFDDIDGHGTHVTGLISARTSKTTGIIGVASECNVQNIKVLLDSGDSVGDILLNGLKQIYKQIKTPTDIDIINLSLGVTFSEYSEIIPIIDELSKSTIIVAAAGENDKLLISNEPLYPAFSSKVISVGTIDNTFLQTNPNSIFHHRVDYLLPYNNLVSCSTLKNSLYKELKGSSMATAIVSGIIALLLSNLGKKGNSGVEFVKAELDKIAIKYSNISDFKSINLIKPKYQ